MLPARIGHRALGHFRVRAHQLTPSATDGIDHVAPDVRVGGLRLAAILEIILIVPLIWRAMLWLPWHLDCLIAASPRSHSPSDSSASSRSDRRSQRRRRGTFRRWFFQGVRQIPEGPHSPPIHQAPWWKVMCLTGVDYFSTLGYQPGIAFLAAGTLAPIATIILVCLTLLGALPVYSKVAAASPDGQGSISMLEDLLPRWRGKALVLVLLGFAATDFVITITLSAADATEHIVHNPFVPRALDHPIAVTIVLLTCLGAVFLKGFKEAIGFAVVIVAVYLALNIFVIAYGVMEIFRHPEYVPRWTNGLYTQHGSPVMMLALALLVFPKLALGLSGFETGVAVMPLVAGDRVHNTRKLLRTAALIMSVMLIGSSIVTTLLIPPEAFAEGGEACGPGACLSGSSLSRRDVRHDLRHQHHRHSLVRRSVCDGWTAQSGPAVPPSIRHGAGVDARHPAARDAVHGHYIPHHHHFRCGRPGTGRRVCDGRPGADDVRGDRGHARSVAHT